MADAKSLFSCKYGLLPSVVSLYFPGGIGIKSRIGWLKTHMAGPCRSVSVRGISVLKHRTLKKISV